MTTFTKYSTIINTDNNKYEEINVLTKVKDGGNSNTINFKNIIEGFFNINKKYSWKNKQDLRDKFGDEFILDNYLNFLNNFNKVFKRLINYGKSSISPGGIIINYKHVDHLITICNIYDSCIIDIKNKSNYNYVNDSDDCKIIKVITLKDRNNEAKKNAIIID